MRKEQEQRAFAQLIKTPRIFKKISVEQFGDIRLADKIGKYIIKRSKFEFSKFFNKRKPFKTPRPFTMPHEVVRKPLPYEFNVQQFNRHQRLIQFNPLKKFHGQAHFQPRLSPFPRPRPSYRPIGQRPLRLLAFGNKKNKESVIKANIKFLEI